MGKGLCEELQLWCSDWTKTEFASPAQPSEIEMVASRFPREVSCTTFSNRETCLVHDLVAMPTVEEEKSKDEIPNPADMDLDSSTTTSPESMEVRKNVNRTTSPTFSSMDVDTSGDLILYQSRKTNKNCTQRSLPLSHSTYNKVTQGREMEFYGSRTMTYVAV